MDGIFTYIYHTFKPNVGKYTIHGSYAGIGNTSSNHGFSGDIRGPFSGEYPPIKPYNKVKFERSWQFLRCAYKPGGSSKSLPMKELQIAPFQAAARSIIPLNIASFLTLGLRYKVGPYYLVIHGTMGPLYMD